MKLLWGIAAAVAMGGCALFPAAAPEPAAADGSALPAAADYAREHAEVAALLAYYQDLQAMPQEELRREHQNASQAFARERGELARLRLALLLCVPGTGWSDDARLLALLDGADSRRAPSASPRRHLVVLLQKLVAERQREQKRAEELQHKLDAMLAIERGLRERQPRRK